MTAQTLRNRLVRDDGMTILEILIAAVVLFIVLTAILGLVGSTTMTSLQAKEKNVMVNAVNAYIERVQALPFDEVVVGTGTGELPPEETMTIGEFTVTIRPTIAAGSNPALKNLTLDVSVTSPKTSRTLTMNTTVAVRDRSQYLTQAVQDPATNPQVSFDDALTPPEAAVVWDAAWQNGALNIAASATAAEGRTIEVVECWIDDQYYMKNTFGDAARWTPKTLDWSVTGFIWNTHQTEPVLQEDGVTYVDEEVIADGMRTVSLYAVDNTGATSRVIRHFLVDNDPPGNPGTPVPSPRTSAITDLAWTAASDGTLPADHYQVRMWKQASNQELADNPTAYWFEVPGGTSTGASFVAETQAFSRYWAVVRAQSPRGLSSSYVNVGLPWISRPLLTGSYSVESRSTGNPKYWRVTSTLSASPPAFPVSGTTTYSFYRVDGGQSTLLQSGTSRTCEHTVQVDAKPSSANYPTVQYRVEVLVTPAGYGGGTQTTVYSNTVATTYRGDSGTFTFTEGTW
ncbi:MAG: hypothetical protein Kow0067_05290 [Coriobacteriia bacterium]